MSDRTGPRDAEFARKALHLSMAVVPIAWASGVVSHEQVRIGVAVLAITAVIAEGARLRLARVHQAIERLAGPLLRPHEHRAITGATWLAIGCAVAVFAFPSRAAISALWAVTVGDALAALVGQLISPPVGERKRKTIAGSVTCLVASALGAWWLAGATPLAALAIGAAAAVAERPHAGVNDNVRIVAAAGLAAWVLGVA